MLVLNASNETLRKYTWGLDLSQSVHGAGGIGGLLACVETAGTHEGTYWFTYDANGNVGQLLEYDPQTQTVSTTPAAHYEYDPYGNVIDSSGDYADANPIRFSTKWFDAETDLGYWGYRYYAPALGRWLNRDPIEESGGINMYSALLNDPGNSVDPDGREPMTITIVVGGVAIVVALVIGIAALYDEDCLAAAIAPENYVVECEQVCWKRGICWCRDRKGTGTRPGTKRCVASVFPGVTYWVFNSFTGPAGGCTATCPSGCLTGTLTYGALVTR